MTGTVLAALLVAGRGLARSRRRADLHRRGGAQVGGGRHRGDVAGIEDVGAGAGRPRAVGGDEGRHRHGRGEDVLDDLAHRGIQAAGRIHAQHDELGLTLYCLLQPAADVVGGGGADRAVDLQDEHGRGGGGRFGLEHGQQQTRRHEHGEDQGAGQQQHGAEVR